MDDILSEFKAEWRHNRDIVDDLMELHKADRLTVLEAIGCEEFDKFDNHYGKQRKGTIKYHPLPELDKLKLAEMYNRGVPQKVMADTFKFDKSRVSMTIAHMKRSGKYNLSDKPIAERRRCNENTIT